MLVTGSHYSGTTLVGRVLSSPLLSRYLHEPFNIEKSISQSKNIFDKWYFYIEEDPSRLKALGRIINQNNILGQAFDKRKYIKRPSDILRISKFLYDNLGFIDTLIVKDPIAAFSADRLSRYFDMSVVVMVRHPCAFVESIIRKRAAFPFSDLLSQETLMRDHLAPHRAAMKECSNKGLLEQGALLWLVIYDVLLKYCERNSRFHLFKHEDIVRDPESEFRRMAKAINIGFVTNMEKTIDDLMDTANPTTTDALSGKGYVKRNPLACAEHWRDALDKDQIDYILRVTGPVFERVYRP